MNFATNGKDGGRGVIPDDPCVLQLNELLLDVLKGVRYGTVKKEPAEMNQ